MHPERKGDFEPVVYRFQEPLGPPCLMGVKEYLHFLELNKLLIKK
jgi:hypothetical protein